jgi:hypothetical protein
MEEREEEGNYSRQLSLEESITWKGALVDMEEREEEGNYSRQSLESLLCFQSLSQQWLRQTWH